MKKFLLVEPDFPVPAKSKNHKNFLPIGLLKIAAYQRNLGNEVILARGIPKNDGDSKINPDFYPDEIWVTSLFTYWAKYVKEAVHFYKNLYPKAIVKVGGVYASLFPVDEVISYTGCDDVHQGVIPEVEKYTETDLPAYDLINGVNPHPLDYQIIHTSRGCPRKCPYCGVWKIEPDFEPKESIIAEIKYSKVIIYDNNFLMNPHIENILGELIWLKQKGITRIIECQSGIDGRVLQKQPKLARMMKEAGFRYPRIAWDWGYNQHENIKTQLDILTAAGYTSKDISVFMIYNYDFPFNEMEKKRLKCWEWQVQIADCRNRPLFILEDNYSPRKKNQSNGDYYIHDKWSDAEVRLFRKNVRRQNICVRHRTGFYSAAMEFGRITEEEREKLNSLVIREEKMAYLRDLGDEIWSPDST